MRNALAILCICLPATLFAQAPRTYTRGSLPARTDLDKLNLKTDWSIFIPVASRHDGLATVQLVDETQLFVQTKSGTLVAVDATTGRQQWNFRHPTNYPTMFPVAVNSKYVFVLSVARLYCLNRGTGAIELDYDLPAAPSTGPVADFEYVYISYTSKVVQAFALPANMRLAAAPKDIRKLIEADLKEKQATQAKGYNVADDIAKKYATRFNTPQPRDLEIDSIKIPKGYLDGSTGDQGARPERNNPTPSLTATNSVLPPYNLGGLSKVESIQILPSLRRPYQLKPDYMQYNQATPSIGALPPSVARIYEMANLRPPPLEPTKKWTYSTDARVITQPTLVGSPQSVYLWIPTDNRSISAIRALSGPKDGSAEIQGLLSAAPAAPMSRPAVYEKDTLRGFLPLSDGQLLAVDLFGGSFVGIRTAWKSNIGGLMNHKPFAAKDGIYASGEHSGIAKVDAETGDVVWKTENDADYILAMNDEFVYVRDQHDHLLVYEKVMSTKATTARSRAIASMDISSLNVPVQNDVTDRILLASDNGLIVALRDQAAKYAKPMMVAPPSNIPPEPEPQAPEVPKQ